MARKRKRIVIISDMHSGHVVGLTPPDFWQNETGGTVPRQDKFARIQRESWEWYRSTIASLKPIDVLLVNGDCIDGRGERSGGTELLTSNRQSQVDMAVQCIKLAKASAVMMTYGTAYHTGQLEDWEDAIAERVDASIGSHEWPEVNGLVFDMKHHIGSSSIPHGRHTAIARDRLWNVLWAERERQPKARVIIRSHVHYFQAVQTADFLALTTPALQAAGTKYGGRRCSGTVDFGLIHFDVDEHGGYTWKHHQAALASESAHPTVLCE